MTEQSSQVEGCRKTYTPRWCLCCSCSEHAGRCQGSMARVTCRDDQRVFLQHPGAGVNAQHVRQRQRDAAGAVIGIVVAEPQVKHLFTNRQHVRNFIPRTENQRTMCDVVVHNNLNLHPPCRCTINLTWKRARGSMVRCSGRLRIISSSTRPMFTTAFTRVLAAPPGLLLDAAVAPALLVDLCTSCTTSELVSNDAMAGWRGQHRAQAKLPSCQAQTNDHDPPSVWAHLSGLRPLLRLQSVLCRSSCGCMARLHPSTEKTTPPRSGSCATLTCVWQKIQKFQTYAELTRNGRRYPTWLRRRCAAALRSWRRRQM